MPFRRWYFVVLTLAAVAAAVVVRVVLPRADARIEAAASLRDYAAAIAAVHRAQVPANFHAIRSRTDAALCPTGYRCYLVKQLPANVETYLPPILASIGAKPRQPLRQSCFGLISGKPLEVQCFEVGTIYNNTVEVALGPYVDCTARCHLTRYSIVKLPPPQPIVGN